MATSVPELFLDQAQRRQAHAVRLSELNAPAVRHRPLVFFAGVLALGLLAAVAVVVQRVTAPDALPIREIRVAGEFRYLQPDSIRALVTAAIDAGFFAVDVNALRARILREPWVRDASIRRVWPERLQVTIVEQVPVARWGARALLSAEGRVFTPAQLPAGRQLVQLDGPDGFEGEVLERYRRYAPLLDGAGLALAALELSSRRAWTLTTAEGVRVRLGRKSVDARLARFLRVYQAALARDWARIEAVDMRYTNGVAVRRRAHAAGG